MNNRIFISILCLIGTQFAMGEDKLFSDVAAEYYFSEAIRSASVLASKYRSENKNAYEAVYSKTLAKYLFIKWKVSRGVINREVIVDVMIAISGNPDLSGFIKNPFDLSQKDFSDPEAIRVAFERNALGRFETFFGYGNIEMYLQDVIKFNQWIERCSVMAEEK